MVSEDFGQENARPFRASVFALVLAGGVPRSIGAPAAVPDAMVSQAFGAFQVQGRFASDIQGCAGRAGSRSRPTR